MSDSIRQANGNYRISSLRLCIKRIQYIQDLITEQDQFYKKHYDSSIEEEVKTSSHYYKFLQNRLKEEWKFKDEISKQISATTC